MRDSLGRFVKGYFQKTRANTVGIIPWNKGLKGVMTPPSRKGCVPWNKGKKGLQVSWSKGKKLSLAHREKLSKSHKGLKVSEETKRKLSKLFEGANAPFWKGGITPLYQKIRSCLEYRLWRSDCFRRDDFTCQTCRIRGGNLIVDHIKRFSVIIAEHKITSLEEALACEELWDINNGRVLCVSCHKMTETWGTKGLHGRKYRITA